MLIDETTVSDYIQGINLEAKSVYYIDELPGKDHSITLIVYNTGDVGQRQYSTSDILSQSLFNSLHNFFSPEVVTKIKAGQYKFEKVGDKDIKSPHVLVVNQNGEVRNWGDIKK